MLDRAAIGTLAAHGVAVLALTDGHGPAGIARMRALGAAAVRPVDAPGADLAEGVRAALAGRDGAPGPAWGLATAARGGPRRPSGRTAPAGGGEEGGESEEPVEPVGDGGHRPPPRGALVAVWGPVGAPGRTTVAVNLAAE